MLTSIPACAGEPISAAKERPLGWVYPRVRGGTRYVGCGLTVQEGLSPRARGNLQELIHLVLIRGSIPACAGEPGCSGSIIDHIRVYPRVRGGTIGAPLVE